MKPLLLVLLLGSNLFAAERTYVGWVSDSRCARARASAGAFTATDPDCARECIKEGHKIVFISPETKTVFAVENPEALKAQVGNKVRISGIERGTRLLHVNEVLSSTKENPECERPPLKQ